MSQRVTACSQGTGLVSTRTLSDSWSQIPKHVIFGPITTKSLFDPFLFPGIIDCLKLNGNALKHVNMHNYLSIYHELSHTVT